MGHVRSIFAFAVVALLCVGVIQADVAFSARVTLIAFVLATAAWVCTRWSETGIALATACALAATDTIDSEQLFSGLGDDVVWLLIGGFMIAGVIRRSGLIERYILRALVGSGSVRALFHRLMWLIFATAFVIPSTSGRAALLLPVYLALVSAFDDRRLDRGLALLFPSVILLSACASLLGAGAHLVAVDFMAEVGLREFDFLDWALLGAPFAIVTSLIATELILHLFVARELHAHAPKLPTTPVGPISQAQRNVALIVIATVMMWATGALHGLDPALITVFAAVAVANKPVGGMSMKDAIKCVEWNLILFLAATLVLGEALLDSGAAEWVARETLRYLPASLLDSTLVISIAALVSMLSHLLITSRSARAAVLIPTLALPLAIVPSQAAVLILVAVIGSGFCQTLRVSAKPVVLYSEQEGRQAYSDADLMHLSLWLMLPFALALITFAVYVWPALGLGLSAI